MFSFQAMLCVSHFRAVERNLWQYKVNNSIGFDLKFPDVSRNNSKHPRQSWAEFDILRWGQQLHAAFL